jgi:CheY-like chemotaxis protein
MTTASVGLGEVESKLACKQTKLGAIMILVVDDSAEYINWLRDVIEAEGYYYDAAPDATAALYKLEHLYYSMALIDIKLPGGINGDVLARKIKELPEPQCFIPLIGMTGGDYEPEDPSPFIHLLRKPFLPRDIRSIISANALPPIKDLHATRKAVASIEPPVTTEEKLEKDSIPRGPDGSIIEQSTDHGSG